MEIDPTFGPAWAARRSRSFGRLRDPKDAAQMLLAPLYLVPERAPDWAFTEEFRADVLG
jgi:hypothetical protein